MATGLNAPKYSKAWWADTADRVVSTVAQTGLGLLTVGVLAPNILTANLPSVAAVSGTAGLLAFLKALALTKSGVALEPAETLLGANGVPTPADPADPSNTLK